MSILFCGLPFSAFADTLLHTQTDDTNPCHFSSTTCDTMATSTDFGAIAHYLTRITMDVNTPDSPLTFVSAPDRFLTSPNLDCSANTSRSFTTVTSASSTLRQTLTIIPNEAIDLTGIKCIAVALRPSNRLLTDTHSYIYAASTLQFFGAQYQPYGSLYGDGIPPTEAHDTHFITVTPADGATIATSSAATFGATGYITDADYGSAGADVVLKYLPKSAQQSAVACFDCLATTLTFHITGAGFFSFSTTSPALTKGEYTMYSSIVANSFTITAFGFNLFPTSVSRSATTTQFTADAATSYDIFVSNMARDLKNAIDLSTGSTSCAVATFVFTDCLHFIFWPNVAMMLPPLTAFKDGFLSYFPFGYVTRVVEIVTGTVATSSLPTTCAPLTLGAGDATTTYHLCFNENEIWTGAGTLLNSFKDPETGMSIQDEWEPYFRALIALIVIFIIFFDVLHTRKPH